MRRAEEREKSNLIEELTKAVIEKIKGVKSLKKQLEFLLNPEKLETTSRLSKNQVMAINQGDWLGDNFYRFKPLKDFWRGFALWRISLEGKGRQEAISLTGATHEPKVLGVFPWQKKKGED